MREKFLPFSLPDIGEEEIAEVTDSLRSGWITTGPKVKRFEEDFAAFVGAKYAVAVSSATAGLHLVYLACGLKGKKVLTTPLTFAATANMLVNVGAKPVFADIDREILNIDPGEIEKANTGDIKAVVPVHYAGAPCDMDRIMALAKKNGWVVIEDCAHSIGAYYKGRHTGLFGHAGIFSFHPIKNITTGEGGMIVTDDEALADELQLLRFHGMDKDAWKRYDKAGRAGYDIVRFGYKYNMMDIQAALGIHQLKKLKAFNSKRSEIAHFYRENLRGLEEITFQKDPSYDFVHPWHLFVAILRTDRLTREEAVQKLKGENIGSGIHYPALHSFSCYRKKFRIKKGTYPNSEYVGERIFSLPLYTKMTVNDMRDVVEAVKKTFK
jgi:dTDP-4-amino-4,6-dideoxygalactose transaminase